jgi:hypothetical protein
MRHVARMRRQDIYTECWQRNLFENIHLEDQGDGRGTLK